MSMGSRNNTMLQPISDKTKRILCREKKKKANPTMPYSFTSVPTTMKNAASVSRSFSIRKNASRIIPAMAMLNCCMKRAVSNSWAQNHKRNIC